MRICSFVPGATEIVAALGLADHLVGISHECDFPPSVAHVPVMIEPLVGRDAALSADIDQQVKTMAASGQRLYRLNEAAFHGARPDLILTQDLCHVCAVTPDQLGRAIQSLERRPEMVSVSPTSLNDMFADIERIARAVGKVREGQALLEALRRRLETVRSRTATRRSRPRVVCLEWLGPLYLGGHWVPEMVELAGGQDVLGSKDGPSRETTWQEVEAARPDVVVVMPCGYTIDRTLEELSHHGERYGDWARALHRWPRTYAVNAAAHFSRPGPRLVDGVEVLALILHPDDHTPLDPEQALALDATALGMEPPL
jgi:iron complex transport system substrate-binding protein